LAGRDEEGKDREVNEKERMKEEGGRRKEEGGRRKEEGGRRKEEGGRRKEEGGKAKKILQIMRANTWFIPGMGTRGTTAVFRSGKAASELNSGCI
jgi:ATP-dependent RNA helicase DHX57